MLCMYLVSGLGYLVYLLTSFLHTFVLNNVLFPLPLFLSEEECFYSVRINVTRSRFCIIVTCFLCFFPVHVSNRNTRFY